MAFKLNWTVQKAEDGSFLRRKEEGDSLDLDHIDVEWKHADGFPPDTISVPTSHPPDIKYETREAGTRDVVKDQVSVGPNVSDGTVALLLDEKRSRLAAALGVCP